MKEENLHLRELLKEAHERLVKAGLMYYMRSDLYDRINAALKPKTDDKTSNKLPPRP